MVETSEEVLDDKNDAETEVDDDDARELFVGKATAIAVPVAFTFDLEFVGDETVTFASRLVELALDSGLELELELESELVRYTEV